MPLGQFPPPPLNSKQSGLESSGQRIISIFFFLLLLSSIEYKLEFLGFFFTVTAVQKSSFCEFLNFCEPQENVEHYTKIYFEAILECKAKPAMQCFIPAYLPSKRFPTTCWGPPKLQKKV